MLVTPPARTLGAMANRVAQDLKRETAAGQQTGLVNANRRAKKYGKPWTADMLRYQRHEHPIRWDPERQLWVCTTEGCGYERPAREREIVTGPDDDKGFQPMVGHGDPVDQYTRKEDW